MSLLKDVERLKKTAMPEVRESIASKISGYYANGLFDSKEARLASDIIRLLSKDSELQVRKILAENLQWQIDVPRDIVFVLAQDAIDVALPILKNSKVLSDEDLISLIKNITDSRALVAISRRDVVTIPLVDALIKDKNREVVINILVNKGTDISESAYKAIISNFAKDNKILFLLADRGDLPLNIVYSLFSLVDEEVKEQLISMYNINVDNQYKFKNNQDKTTKENNLTNDYSEVMQKFLLANSDSNLKNNNLLVNQLYNSGQLNQSIVLKELCEGNVNFFEVAIAKLAKISYFNATEVVADSNLGFFEEICRKAEIPASIAEAMFILLFFAVKTSENKLSKENYAKSLLEYIVSNGYDRTVSMMSYIIAIICRENKLEQLMAG